MMGLTPLLASFSHAQEADSIFNDKYLAQQKPVEKGQHITRSITTPLKQERKNFLLRWFTSKAYAEANNVNMDRKRIRQEWQRVLGLDIFYPYFKAQEIKEVVQEKTHVQFFNMKGRAEFDESKRQVRYIFKRKF
ncbi:MAG TPA: hypothetical protein P5110_06515 [Candidatus Omnitrophota bacterium]|nr:hypothetical protein [Candidatus Omnitrophota bacterium]